MKKEEKEISVNKSSGAEKVEKIQKTVKKAEGKQGQTVKNSVKSVSKKTETAKGESAMGNPVMKKQKSERISAKKMNAESSGSKAELESAKAKERVERALKRKEEQEKRKKERMERVAKRKAKKEKRIAEKKALIEKRKAEKKAQIERRAKEKEEKLRERAKEKANRKQKRAWTKKKKQEEDKQKRVKKREHDTRKKAEKKEREKGYGGWIATVVTLGVTTLVLASTVTVGAIEMRKANEGMLSAYRGTVYELTGIMEHIDNDLDRARISNTATQQSRILSDLLVQSRLAELDIEKLPVSGEADRNLTSFVNRTAKTCEILLSKLASGESLSAEDNAKLEKLYQTNHAVRTELEKLTKTTDKDFMNFMKKGKGAVADLMTKLENLTLEENSISFDKIKDKAEKKAEELSPKTPKEEKGIDPAKAEELCLQYFAKYNVKEYQCVGETVARGYSAYNLQGYDDKGTMLFAEISQADGKLLRFDYYEDCNTETFDIQNAELIAEEFLYGLGYEDMEVARFRENGTTTDFTFVYETDGVAYYPDEVHIKVCRSRGVVTGMDATKYLKNHKQRKEPTVKISMQQAKDTLSDKLTVESSKLVVVGTQRGERTAYEFLCSYAEEYYFVFLDACTGEEIAILNTKTVQ